MDQKITTIDEYIALQSEEIQDNLKSLRSLIRELAPQATEKISWGMPTFVLNGNLVHFATQKKHIGFYPSPSAVDMFRTELEEYHCSKGAIQFPYTKPLPMELISRMVKFRVDEQLSRGDK